MAKNKAQKNSNRASGQAPTVCETKLIIMDKDLTSNIFLASATAMSTMHHSLGGVAAGPQPTDESNANKGGQAEEQAALEHEMGSHDIHIHIHTTTTVARVFTRHPHHHRNGEGKGKGDREACRMQQGVRGRVSTTSREAPGHAALLFQWGAFANAKPRSARRYGWRPDEWHSR